MTYREDRTSPTPILVGSSKTRMLVEIQKIKTTFTMFQIEMRSLSNIGLEFFLLYSDKDFVYCLPMS